ncbi:hypothetical protein SAMN05216548_10776 [Faunimonas pinastri]|uniref:Uncharacterized protein n=1 Tax=Faunimonas pinastri TaxID=1855383 RepID=A0A1H9IE15_9HYPH|nr:hypothetical protein SAMN05216548_10776 [Faunimonas pinastri]
MTLLAEPGLHDLGAVKRGRAFGLWQFFNDTPLNVVAIEIPGAGGFRQHRALGVPRLDQPRQAAFFQQQRVRAVQPCTRAARSALGPRCTVSVLLSV